MWQTGFLCAQMLTEAADQNRVCGCVYQPGSGWISLPLFRHFSCPRVGRLWVAG